MASARLFTVASHIQSRCAAAGGPTVGPHSSDESSWTLAEIVLGDTPAAWDAAGFTVVLSSGASGAVSLGGGLVVRLTGEGEGLKGIVFQCCPHTHHHPTRPPPLPPPPPQLPGIETVVMHQPPGTAAEQQRSTTPLLLSHHRNTCRGLGEITFYTRHLQQVVDGFAAAGVMTYRNKQPRALPGGAHRVAKYFFGSTRVLITGPSDPTTPTIPPAVPQMAWMFGSGDAAAAAGLELTGWLPVVESIDAVVEACRAVGKPKPALQEGRSIATLKAGAVPGITGTVAFLAGGLDGFNLK